MFVVTVVGANPMHSCFTFLLCSCRYLVVMNQCCVLFWSWRRKKLTSSLNRPPSKLDWHCCSFRPNHISEPLKVRWHIPNFTYLHGFPQALPLPLFGTKRCGWNWISTSVPATHSTPPQKSDQASFKTVENKNRTSRCITYFKNLFIEKWWKLSIMMAHHPHLVSPSFSSISH